MADKLIIDADPGIGDAVAIALALQDASVDVLALTATGGRTSGENATHNLEAIVSLLDPDRWPRIGCSDLPVAALPKDRNSADPRLLDGPRGLGDWETPAVSLHQRHESPKLLAELVRNEPNEITLLTLGPLTNVQLACDWHPEFFSDLKALVCLGGSITGDGDVTPAAEFNIFGNPEAARAVLGALSTKTLVPLETSRRLLVSFEQYDRWDVDPMSRLGRLFDQIVPYALRASRQYLGIEGIVLPEVVALASIVEPRLFTHEAMSVDVELSGELTRGMTVFDRRSIDRWQKNIEVLTDVDAQGVLDYMSRQIRRPA